MGINKKLFTGGAPETLGNDFTVKKYTGNGGTQNITTGFNPVLTIFRALNHDGPWAVYDDVRGGLTYLRTDSQAADATSTTYGVTSFTTSSTSITVKDDTNGGFNINGSSGGLYAGNPADYILYAWKASDAFSHSASGSQIASSGKSNQVAGFSIVSYTGNGSAGATIAHNLGASPELVICKSRDTVADWNVFSSVLSTNYMMKFNTTGVAFDGSSGTNGGAFTVSSILLTVVGG